MQDKAAEEQIDDVKVATSADGVDPDSAMSYTAEEEKRGENWNTIHFTPLS